jgi:simple sugar transport system ATP-binding protein
MSMQPLPSEPIDQSAQIPDGPALAVRSIRKSFGAVEVLRGISLEVPRGKVTALVGDNGAGKSTLVKIICGVHSPEEGEILLDGKPVKFFSPEDARKAGIEAVYQDLAIAPHLNVFANFYLGRELRRGGLPGLLRVQDRREMLKRTRKALDELHIEIPSLAHPVTVLSGGQRQAVAVARAVTWARAMVIMDEPTAALGVSQTEAVLELIRKVRDTGRTVLMITHSLPEVFAVADHIAVLRRGEIAAVLEPEGTTMEEIVGYMTGALVKS